MAHLTPLDDCRIHVVLLSLLVSVWFIVLVILLSPLGYNCVHALSAITVSERFNRDRNAPML